MRAALLKMDHPFFLVFSGLNRGDGGFRPHSGFSCLFRSADIFAGPRDDFYAGHTAGRYHNNRPGRESSAGKCRKPYGTIGIGVEVITKWTCLRPCKQPEDRVGLYLSGGFRLFAVALISEPEVAASGFLFSVFQLNVKNGMRRIKRIFQILQQERE